MRMTLRVGLAVACVAGLLMMTWWVCRQLEADACLDAGRVSD